MRFSVLNAYKCLQRRYYDVSNSRKSATFIVLITISALVVILHVTEIWYGEGQVISSSSARDYKLCPGAVIDVVYTWVNGSDSVFLREMQEALGGIRDEFVYNDTIAARYRDKEELRYSLRSLEKYAPWVRHIYIVTNGQIPYWLDLECPRVTLVPHREIFPYPEDLPTFSSPAIEAHLHRIPGLSEHFIYFNDDIFLGKPISPDDFFTQSKGYKVFLSWSVPDCSSECPWAWVGDGTCDPPCNNQRCAFDNGDCDKETSKSSYPKVAPTLPHIITDLQRLNPEIADEVKKVENFYRGLKKNATSRGRDYLNASGRNDLEKKFSSSRKLFSDSVIINQTLEIKKLLPQKTYSKVKIHDLLKTQNVSEAVRISNKKYLADRVLKKRGKRKRMSEKVQTEPSLVIKLNPSNVIGAAGMSLMTVNQSALSIRFADKPDWSEVNGTSNKKTERPLDMFGESLLFVHKLYNRVFGVRSRKVPAHMPHLFNKTIMMELQNRFPIEWRETSRHRFRHPNDMQLAFSYYHYISSSTKNRTVREIFYQFDTDSSGFVQMNFMKTWSDREIRTVLARLYGTPLTLPAVLEFESIINNCSKKVPADVLGTAAPYDRYIDSSLPTVSLALVEKCPALVEALLEEFPNEKMFKTETVYDKQQDGIFKGLINNLSVVLETLDYIRANERKFICLNDNIANYEGNDEEMIIAVLHDFFLSLYPLPSHFELPPGTRNRFLHIADYREWKQARQRVFFWISAAFVLAVLGTIYILFQAEMNLISRYFLLRTVVKGTGQRRSSAPSPVLLI